VDGAGHEAVTFEAAQSESEHPLGEAVDGAMELAETHGAVAELPPRD
jgi:hypothetical protein